MSLKVWECHIINNLAIKYIDNDIYDYSGLGYSKRKIPSGQIGGIRKPDKSSGGGYEPMHPPTGAEKDLSEDVKMSIYPSGRYPIPASWKRKQEWTQSKQHPEYKPNFPQVMNPVRPANRSPIDNIIQGIDDWWNNALHGPNRPIGMPSAVEVAPKIVEPIGFADPNPNPLQISKTPDMTQPLVPPTNKEVIAQQKQDQKKHHHKKTKKKSSSLTIPANYPVSVTLTPSDTGDTDEQYLPADQTDQPGVISTPATPPPSSSPAPGLPTPGSFYPFKPQTGSSSGGHYDENGCAPLKYGSGHSGRTCRWVADTDTMKARIGSNGYKIEVNLHIGNKNNDWDKEISITSGGPGSREGNCCGFTARINIDSGELQMEAEGAAKTDKIFCKGASCVDGGPTSIGKNLYNKDVYLAWICTKQNGHASYQMVASGPSGTVTSKKLVGPKSSSGHEIIPFQYISVGKKGIANDSSRIRVDSCDTVKFDAPKVTALAANSYYGNVGYIDNRPYTGELGYL